MCFPTDYYGLLDNWKEEEAEQEEGTPVEATNRIGTRKGKRERVARTQQQRGKGKRKRVLTER